jgi:hypothetical protein
MFRGVAHNPEPLSPVRGIDGTSRNSKREDFVPCVFQVRTHRLEYHALLDRHEARNVLSDDPTRSNFPYDSKHLRPEMAVVCLASSLPGNREGLAREPAGEDGWS